MLMAYPPTKVTVVQLSPSHSHLIRNGAAAASDATWHGPVPEIGARVTHREGQGFKWGQTRLQRMQCFLVQYIQYAGRQINLAWQPMC